MCKDSKYFVKAMMQETAEVEFDDEFPTKVGNRRDRRRATALAKKSRQELADAINNGKNAYVYINGKGKVFDLGEKDYGKKHHTRKIRHERFEEPMPEVQKVGRVTLDEEPDYGYAMFDYGFYDFRNGTFDRFDFTGNKSIIFDERLSGQLVNVKAEIYRAIQQHKKDLLDKKLALVKEDVELLKKVNENTRKEEEIDRQIRELDEQF